MKTTPLKDGPFTKTVDGKIYHFCSRRNGAPSGAGCNKWVRHKPSECQGRLFSFAPGEANPVTKPGFVAKTKKQKELQVKAATLGLVNASISDEAIANAKLESNLDESGKERDVGYGGYDSITDDSGSE